MQNDSFNVMQPKKHSPIPLIVLTVLLLISLGFALWAFISMEDYKNNSDKKSDAAVSKALAEQKTKLDTEYEEKAKSPFESYTAGSEFGSLAISYPKTWELYVDAKISGATSSIEGYAHPNYVPGLAGDTSYALRFQVSTREYPTELKTFDGSVKAGLAKVEPYRLEKVQNVLGSKVVGQITSKKSGVMYIFPLRDKTIKVWTESNSYNPDLDVIMKSFAFIP